jgi:Zn-dependent protease with chaperone function
MSRALLALLGAGLLSACASLPTPDAEWRRWSQRQGGLETGRTVPAAESALARLSACACPEIRVRVLANDRTDAFGWRDGTVFVTRGLVVRLSGEELAAAIAHEIAHVRGAITAEAEADRRGAELLRASGLAPELMAAMLAKVAAGGAPDRRIEARIVALGAGSAQDAAPARDLAALLD